MSLLIINCNHWIGYHLVDALLDLEYQIDGILDESENDDVALFFGRNSRFNLLPTLEDKQYETCFIIGAHAKTSQIKAGKIIIIDPDHSLHCEKVEQACIIKGPLLYGEWMSMREKGFYLGDEWISFHSKRFQEEAVYIKDFIVCLLQIMHAEHLPSTVKVVSKHEKKADPNAVYIRKDTNKDEKVDQLLKQYKKWNIIN